MKGKRKAVPKAGAAKTSSNTTTFSTDSSSMDMMLMMMDDQQSNRNILDAALPGGVSGGGGGDIVIRDDKLKEDCGFNSSYSNNEDGDEEEEDDYEGEDGKGEEELVEEDVRPKLDEGFYEIEFIRRKRVRKGQLQYFIKWRGWPETANTWEPLENLQSCSDVIDSFEESLHSGKSSRKRKRKYGVTHTQPKKKQSRSFAGHNVTGLDIGVVDKPLPSASLDNTSSANPITCSGFEEEDNVHVSVVKTAKKADDNGYVNGAKHNIDEKEDTEYDPKLSELKGIISTNDINADNKLAIINFEEGNTPGAVGGTNGISKADYVDNVQNSRQIGAKRRKCGSVKRFKKELAMSEPVSLQSSPFYLESSPLNVSVGLGGAASPGFENVGLTESNAGCKPVGANSITITKIIKPIGFSASVMNDIQDVLVTFVAIRSDGKEVIVDNSFLKANYPLLLIDFYEQHLKYST
ncbi:chromo domain-containing protein LHP1 [Mercurialis annua]|uniref:chromo domain-containing protein LHP1 n=1 Tax=Mercurialis annua TaxID=3986 RepID=UPI00215F98AF|nr:chromo domain-containing protein LHP1 [Mercurialis annua]